MKNFLHFDAKSVDEAVSLLSQYGEKAKVIAGGTDLLGELKDRVHPKNPEVLVNIKTIPNLAYITEDGAGLKIGVLTTLNDIANSRAILDRLPLLAQAARSVGTPQLRYMGTIGGNLCQHVRCWYYRSSRNYFFCYRKGGTVCFAIAGDNRYEAILGGKVCFSVCPSDTAPALVALDAKVKINGKAAGERVIPLAEFFTVLGDVLKLDEIITEIQIPQPPTDSKQVFLKLALRQSVDFALVSVAARITPATGTVSDARIVLGGVAPIPYRATAAEDALKGKTISESVADAAAKAAVTGATPLSKNAYKVEMTKAIVKRAIMK